MYSGGQSIGMFCRHRVQDMHLCQPRASPLLIQGLPQDSELSTKSRAAEKECDEAGPQQDEVPESCRPGDTARSPQWAGLVDTHPPATGILL